MESNDCTLVCCLTRNNMIPINSNVLQSEYATKEKKGRLMLPLFQRIPLCPCGGKSGKVQCKMAVSCELCHICKAGCLANGKCQRLETLPHTPKRTRLATDSIVSHAPVFLA